MELREAVRQVLKEWDRPIRGGSFSDSRTVFAISQMRDAYKANEPEPMVCVCGHPNTDHGGRTSKCGGITYKRTRYRSGHVVEWGKPFVCDCQEFRGDVKKDGLSILEIVGGKMWKGEQRQRYFGKDEFGCALEVVEVEGQGFVVTYNGTSIFLVPPKEDEHDGQIQVKGVTIDL